MKILKVHESMADCRCWPKNRRQAIAILLGNVLVDRIKLHRHAPGGKHRQWCKPLIGAVAFRLRAPAGVGMGLRDFHVAVGELSKKIPEWK